MGIHFLEEDFHPCGGRGDRGYICAIGIRAEHPGDQVILVFEI